MTHSADVDISVLDLKKEGEGDEKSAHKVYSRIALAIKTGEAIITVLVPCTACFRRRCAP